MSEVLQKVLGVATVIIGIVFILDAPLYLTQTSLFYQQYVALFWSWVTVLIFLTLPATKKAPTWYDWLLIVLTLIIGFYIAIFYPKILLTLAITTPFRTIMGVIAVVIVLESIRRVAGWTIIILVLAFIFYAKFGNLFPGLLQTKGVSWSRLFNQLYLGSDFMLGIPLKVTSAVVFAFILFGQVIFMTGGGEFLIKLSMCLMGRYRGGPAKVAVIASSLFGSVSGSAAANVTTTGVVTIPLMKRTGYSSTYAGAIEATASTGGQILPPIMGAAAFIMAEFLNTPYSVVATAAVVPALLYYLGLYLQIDFQAVKKGQRGLASEEIPSLKETLREGWFFIIPFLVLVGTLFVLFMSPGKASLYSIGALILITLPKKETRATWKWGQLVYIAQDTSRAMFEVVAISAAAGFIVGQVAYTGLGISLARVLVDAAGGNLFFLAALTALTSIILGMGMPTSGAYILLAVLVAPALTRYGVPPLLAHLFVLYFGVLSMITPPIAIAAYAAAGLAKAPLMPLAFQSMKLAVAAYVVPFIFLYMPGLGLIGSFWEIARDITFAVFIVSLSAVGLEGYLLRKLTLFERGLILTSTVAMFVPNLAVRLAALVIVISLLAVQMRSGKHVEAA